MGKESKVIVIGSQKGGVGKTTLTINLCFHLVEQGASVLLVDGDSQGNTTEQLAKTLDGDPMPLTGHSYADLFNPEVGEVEVMSCPRGFDLIHTPPNDARLSEMMQLDLEQAMVPMEWCRNLFKRYDFVLIDSPPSLGSILFSQLVMADHVFIPVRVSAFAATGAAGLIQTIIGVKRQHNPGLSIAGVITNFYKPKSREHQRSLAYLREELGDTLLTNVINDRVPIDTAIDFGVPIRELKYAHVADREVRKVLNEMQERLG